MLAKGLGQLPEGDAPYLTNNNQHLYKGRGQPPRLSLRTLILRRWLRLKVKETYGFSKYYIINTLIICLNYCKLPKLVDVLGSIQRAGF